MFLHKEELIKLTKAKKVKDIRNFLENLPKTEKGDAFECYIAELYRGNGWLSHWNGGKGDNGADVLIYHPKSPNEVVYVIQSKNQKQPLTFDDTLSELNKFEKKAKHSYNCNHYKIIAINGFVKMSYELQEYNMSLETWNFVEELILNYDSNGKSEPKIDLYAHNKIAYENVLKRWKKDNKVAVIQATGTGKSFIIIKALNDYFNKMKLVLAPSNIILNEIKKNAHWLESSTVYMTYAKLKNIRGKELNELKPSLIILDEFHRVGSEVWGAGLRRIMRNNPTSKILGTTATPIRYLDSQRNMANELFNNNIAIELSLTESIVKGILPSPKYISALYTLENEIEIIKEKIENSKKFVREKERMIRKISKFSANWERTNGIPTILKKHIQNDESKFLVFCKNKRHLEEMEWLVEKWFKMAGFNKRIRKYRMFSGDYNSKHDLSEFRKVNTKKEIHLLFSIDMLNEGAHLEGVDGVILLRPTESPIVFYQQIGRAITASGKTHPLIFDLVNNFKQIKAIDFTSELEAAKKKEDQRRKKLGLPLNDIIFDITDETEKVVSLFAEIEKKLHVGWDEYYQELKEFRSVHGDCEVPMKYKNKSLRNWMNLQRMSMKKDTISQEKIKKLNDIDFIWEPYDEGWQEMYQKLIKYKELHGNCVVPYNYTSNKSLSNWVAFQRRKASQNTLSKEREAKLDDIGFVWNLEDYKWEEKYQEFIRLSSVSETNITYKNNRELKVWINYQKRDFKNGSLSPAKIDKLNQAKFHWGEYKDWDTFFSELCAYKMIHGSSNVPKKDIENQDLYIWSQNQRTQFKTKRLEEVKILKLKNIEFDFAPKKSLWYERYKELKEYYEKCGDTAVPNKFLENQPLSSWIRRQRRLYKENKLETEKLNLLNKIHFIWDSNK